ncbi:MAG: T9SS type A sorting domain-containing protein [Bacteroidales bacterium]|nr:T9SS type A sorting domain-containing protein [Bacteroidales bacterium]
MIKYIFTILFSIISFSAFSQWAMRSSFNNVVNVEKFGNKVVAFCNHALFIADYEGDINTFSKSNGLSSADISAGFASEDGKFFIVGYADGNVDLFKNGTIKNFNDVSLGNFLYERKVNSIISTNDLYVIAGDFGISLLKNDMTEIANILRTDNSILSVAVANNIVYAITKSEIFSNSVDDINFQSFDRWKQYQFVIPSESILQQIVAVGDNIYYSTFSEFDNQSKVFSLFDNSEIDTFNGKIQIKKSNNQLLVVSKDEISVYNSTNLLIIHYTKEIINNSSDFNSAINFDGEKIAVATSNNGLFFGKSSSLKNFLPNGPSSDDFNVLNSKDNRLVAGNNGFSILDNNQWANISIENSQQVNSLFFNPYDYHHVFVGTENDILYEYVDNTLKSFHNSENSEMPSSSTTYQTGIIGMASTPDASLLILRNGNNPLTIFAANGSWHIITSAEMLKSFELKSITQVSDYVFWINLGKNGIFAIDLNSTPLDFSDDKTAKFYPFDMSGEKLGTEILSLSVDLQNQVWVGSNSGIARYSKPDNVFNNNYSCSRSIVTTKFDDNVDYSNYLLRYSQINDICCDAADRKWIATNNSGVFLVSDDGTSEVFHFDKSNSSLPNDTVLKINYLGQTGEIFFATKSGLCSYTGDVENPSQNLNSVKVFPNPVRPDYKDLIYVSGLENNSDVRITDMAGNLVFKTISEGGKISWDGNNLNGNRCATGVYLIFVVNPDTRDTTVKKLLFVN